MSTLSRGSGSRPAPPLTSLLVVLVLTVGLAGCSLTAGGGGSDGEGGSDKTVVLVTHESFDLPKRLVRQFEDESGYALDVRAAGDAGALTTKLVLTKDNPTGDVAFGVDNTFASRALENDVFAPYAAHLPPGAERYGLPGDDDHALTPVDNASVCVNVDTTWFDEKGIAPPQTLDDLVDPAYEDLFVTPGATTSSPGLAFLLTTVAAKGEDWPDYWQALVDNGAKVTSGWSDAYEVDFTAGGGDGDRPIVLSYSSSPPFTVPEGGTEPTTAALLDTCFRQVEYAGVLAGAENPEGMQEFIDFMLGREFQEALPDNMYVYPVDADVALPQAWEEFAPSAEQPYAVDPADLDADREKWLREWRDIVTQ